MAPDLRNEQDLTAIDLTELHEILRRTLREHAEEMNRDYAPLDGAAHARDEGARHPSNEGWAGVVICASLGIAFLTMWCCA